MLLAHILSALLMLAPADSALFSQETKNHVHTFLEEYLDVRAASRNYRQIIETQKEDGSFPGVDYKSDRRTNWPAMKHLRNMTTLACAWKCSGDPKALKAYRRALSFWVEAHPVSLNWWFNEVAVPKEFGPAALLIREDFSPDDLERAISIFDNVDRRLEDATGRNMIWVAGNMLMRDLLKEDAAGLRRDRDLMAGEVKIVEYADGIQPDWTFHQHGSQLQIGNYGLGFASSLCLWNKALSGTHLQFPGEKMDIIRNYVSECQLWMVWGGYYDFSACGRLMGVDKQKKNADLVADCARQLGLDGASPKGSKYYPYSDYAVYRASDWYASLRMQSNRVIGFECINQNNMKGYFSSDGALLVRREGDEYENIAPCLNWKHIPGATTYDDRIPLWGVEAEKPYNRTDLVFGQAEGDYMAAAMELNRDGLSARKAWFFTPGAIICLGAGISMDRKYEVVTALGQCALKGEVNSGRNWVSHRGVSYVMLDKSKIRISAPDHAGQWRYLDPSYSDKEVHMDLFDAYISHGKAPSDASYAYAVIPTGVSGAEAQAWTAENVTVLENTPDIQQVRVGNMVLTVCWNNAEITIE